MSLKPTPVSLAVEKQRAASADRRLKPGLPPSGMSKSASALGGTNVPAEYVTNLQQQIFFLERKLEAQARFDQAGAPAAAAATVSTPGGEVTGFRGHFQQLEAEYGGKLRAHEAQVEALTQQRYVAQLGEGRAKQLAVEAEERVKAADAKVSEVRQELSAEVPIRPAALATVAAAACTSRLGCQADLFLHHMYGGVALAELLHPCCVRWLGCRRSLTAPASRTRSHGRSSSSCRRRAPS